MKRRILPAPRKSNIPLWKIKRAVRRAKKRALQDRVMNEIREQIRWLREGVAGGHAIKIADSLDVSVVSRCRVRRCISQLAPLVLRNGALVQPGQEKK